MFPIFMGILILSLALAGIAYAFSVANVEGTGVC